MTHIHHFRRTVISLVALSTLVFAAGCVGDLEEAGWDDSEHIGQATFEVRQIPATGVTCVRISVVGTTTVTKDFGNMVAGASTVSLNMDRLPVGSVAVSAMAYAGSTSATACTTSSAPTWIADPSSALLEPGVVSKLNLTFRKNNPVTASVNFVGNIQGIAASTFHTVLLVDGQVYQWGSTGGVEYTVPTLVPGLTGVASLAAGQFFSCGLKTDGTIWCWGTAPAVGVDGTTPVQVAAGRVYSQIDAGGAHVCAVSNGAAYCWGQNSVGELGANPATTPFPTHTSPVTSASSGVVSIEVGLDHACQVASDLDVRCVGGNFSGELARTTSGGTTFSWGDAPNSSPAADIAVSEGGFTLVAMADGSVQSAGSNLWGQLGLGTIGAGGSNSATQFTPVPGLTSVQAVTVGNIHSLALQTDGSVLGWGANTVGQVGDNTNTTRSVPTAVVGLPPARLIAAGDLHSCAVTQDERVYCWGAGTNYQLGSGVRVDAAGPVQVLLH